MLHALALARRGEGRVNPNPLVGAVVVRDGRVIGEGWHTAFGNLHAEREALADCRRRGEDPRGATVYVTLEPCCHTGKTPPCTDALLEARVARVVVGSPDPNPLVAGKGCGILRAAGVEVDMAQGQVLGACLRLNRAFFHFISTGRPLVIAKYAMTLDGKIATRTGASRWITGEAARRRVHEDRRRYASVLVGVGTVIADDPQLTCRLDGEDEAAASPVRMVCDTHLRTPLSSHIVETADCVRTIVATCAGEEEFAPFADRGCELLQVGADAQGHADLRQIVDGLGSLGIDSVIVEGGSGVLGAAFDAGIIDRIQAYVAPKVFGGTSAPSPVGGAGVALPSDVMELTPPEATLLGSDVLLECDVVRGDAPQAVKAVVEADVAAAQAGVCTIEGEVA